MGPVEFFAGAVLLISGGSFAAGYAFRGYIGKEIKQIGAEIRAEVAKATASVKAEVTKL